jgi:N-acetylglucosaminyl-diphospho-decaprenol L-rhamnosyltransferase
MTLPNRTAVVVSSHRLYPTLASCLHGFNSIVDKPEDLIFINNGSSPSLNQLVSSSFPGITVINLSQNRLFCAGYNAGIQAACEKGYEFVLIVNADTEVINPDFVSELLAAAQRWPRAAFLGPLVYYRNQETVQNTWFHFPSVMRNILTWIPWRLFRNFRHPHPPCEEEVEFLNGVCVLCRCAALQDFGLMDEQYGGYVEDADWSWRARKQGWHSVFVPRPSIIHHEEADGYEHFSFKSFLLKRNTVLWYLKAGYKSSALAYALASISLAWLRTLKNQSNSAGRKYRKFLNHLGKTYQSMLFGSQPLNGSFPIMFGEKNEMETWQ